MLTTKIRTSHFRLLLIIALVIMTSAQSQTADTINAYLFPGQGADYRLFNNLQLPPGYRPKPINYPVPEKGQNMLDYALSLTNQIDTTSPFVLIGVSLGGMICSELSDTLHPLKTIIISSAKMRSELPARYRFMHAVPVNKVVPGSFLKSGSFIAQPLFEPDRKNGKEVFVAMLRDKDPKFLKRTTNIIINWKKENYNPDIIHIHGNNDHTLPIRNISYDYMIENGSHMMVYTRAEEINTLLSEILLPIQLIGN